MKPLPLNFLYLLAALNFLLATAVAQLPWIQSYSAPVYVPLAEASFMLTMIGPWWLLARQRLHWKAAALILLAAIPQVWWISQHFTTGKPTLLLLVTFSFIPSLLYFFWLQRFRPQTLDEHSKQLMPMVAFLTTIFLSVASMLRATVIAEPVLDLSVASFQSQLGLTGFEDSVRRFFPWEWDFTFLITILYMNILPASLFMLLALNEEVAFKYLKAWVATVIIGYFTYWLVPVVGPTVASQYFPGVFSSPVADTYLYATGLTEIRNAIPSMHAVWALLLIGFARRFSWPVFIGVCAFSSANLLVTISSGGHWISDILVATPLAALGFYVAARPSRPPLREQVYALGAAFSFILMILTLRFGPDFIVRQAWLCAGFLAATTLFSLALCRRWSVHAGSSAMQL